VESENTKQSYIKICKDYHARQTYKKIRHMKLKLETPIGKVKETTRKRFRIFP
jgi:hypothetical protein